MKKMLILLAAVIITPMLWACSSDDSNPPTKTELLCKAPWKYTTQDDDYPQGCESVFTFKTDKTFTITNCRNNLASIPETWEFTQNETALFLHMGNIDGGRDDAEYTIVKLTETELELKSSGEGSFTLTH